MESEARGQRLRDKGYHRENQMNDYQRSHIREYENGTIRDTNVYKSHQGQEAAGGGQGQGARSRNTSSPQVALHRAGQVETCDERGPKRVRFDSKVQVTCDKGNYSMQGYVDHDALQSRQMKPWSMTTASHEGSTRPTSAARPFTNEWIQRQTQRIAKASPFPTIGGKLSPEVPEFEDQGPTSRQFAGRGIRTCRGSEYRHQPYSPQRQQQPADGQEEYSEEHHLPLRGQRQGGPRGTSEEAEEEESAEQDEIADQIHLHVYDMHTKATFGPQVQTEHEKKMLVQRLHGIDSHQVSTVVEVPQATPGSGAQQIVIAELHHQRPEHLRGGALYLVEFTLHQDPFKRHRRAQLGPPHPVSRRSLLNYFLILHKCEVELRGKCLMWHNNELWAQQDPHPRYIREGDFIQIAIPPAKQERQAARSHNLVDTDEEDGEGDPATNRERTGETYIHIQGGHTHRLQGSGVTEDTRHLALQAAGIQREDYTVSFNLEVPNYIPLAGFCYDDHHEHILVANDPGDNNQVLVLAHLVYQDQGDNEWAQVELRAEWIRHRQTAWELIERLDEVRFQEHTKGVTTLWINGEHQDPRTQPKLCIGQGALVQICFEADGEAEQLHAQSTTETMSQGISTEHKVNCLQRKHPRPLTSMKRYQRASSVQSSTLR